jgi:hypothetical protein
MMILTKADTHYRRAAPEVKRAKGTVHITSAGVRRDGQGHLIYAINSSDPRKRDIVEPYYVTVDERTGEALDCTCPDYHIWREVMQDSCKHMDFCELDAKSKLLVQLQQQVESLLHLMGNVETFLELAAYVYPGPLHADDLDQDRMRLLEAIQAERKTV